MDVDPRMRVLLDDLREQATIRLASVSAMLASLARDREGANDDDEHDPDGAPLSAEWSRLTGLSDAARSELQQVDDAIARLDAGTYGFCASCGNPIPLERLEVRPFAAFCVPCAERLGR